MTKKEPGRYPVAEKFFSYKTNRVLLKEHRYYMRIKPIDSVGEK